MRGRVIIVSRYRRSHLTALPDALFVFGDNMAGFGRAGQARECRGEPNAVGIPTKWRPTSEPEAYFTDAALTEVKPALQQRFRQLARHLDAGGAIVWPADGVGTGLADLPRRAPAIHAYLIRCFDHLCAIAMETQRAETPKSGSVAKP